MDRFAEEIANFGTEPTMYAGLVDETGGLQWYDGRLKFKDAEGQTVAVGHHARAITPNSSAKPRCAILI